MNLGGDRVVDTALIAALASVVIVAGSEDDEGRVVALLEHDVTGWAFNPDARMIGGLRPKLTLTHGSVSPPSVARQRYSAPRRTPGDASVSWL